MERRHPATRSCRINKSAAAQKAGADEAEDAATNRSNGSSTSSKENVASTRRNRNPGRNVGGAAAADAADAEKAASSPPPRKRARLTRRSSAAAAAAAAKTDESTSSSPEVAAGRRNIKRIMRAKDISEATKEAQVAERERLRRIAERQKQQQRRRPQQPQQQQQQQQSKLLAKEPETEIDAESAEKSEIQESPQLQRHRSPRPRQSISPATAPLVLERAPNSGAPLVDVAPRVCRQLKPHQSEAVQFLYDCLYESAEETRRGSVGSGALLAHCMGLGKSLSVIAFLHAVLRRASQQAPLGARSALIVCPLNVALNWANEFKMWLGDEAAQRRCGETPLPVRELTGMRLGSDRLAACRAFIETGGVLIVNYDMFRNLVQGRGLSAKRKQRELYRQALLDPGPDIVVCDEGHVLKSGATGLSKAMCEMRTMRRIVLTGTPLQNNLMEYYTMLSFVKPSLLGTQTEFANRFVNPINNGQHSDSTALDVQLMKRRSHVLHRMLAGCVHRRDYTALTRYLPPKHEYIINVRLGEVQEQMYRKYLEQVRPLIFSHSVSLFADQQVLYRVWTHPHLLKLHEEEAVKRDRWTSSDEEDEDDEENSSDGSDREAGVRRGAECTDCGEEEDEEENDSGDGSSGDDPDGKHRDRQRRRRRCLGSSDDSESGSAADSSSVDEVITGWATRSRGGGAAGVSADDATATAPPPRPPQWWHQMYSDSMADDISLSGKLHILFSLLRSFEEHGDKTLVFSHSLLSLDIIEHFLDKLGIGELGEDYIRLDGSTPAASRKAMSEAFNKEKDRRLRLFLISTKAGGLGVNLPAANRVVIFDVSWNPSHDIQSIFRTYRFGQTKPVSVYRLVAQGTMEEKIYSRQVNKQSLGFRVIDEHQINRHFTAADLVQLYTLSVDRFDPSVDARKRFDLPADEVLADLLAKEARWIASYHLHDSLLENVESELLTDEEREQAWQEYEQEKHARPRVKQQQQQQQQQQTLDAEDGLQNADNRPSAMQLKHSATVADFSAASAQQPQQLQLQPHRVASSAALLQQPQQPHRVASSAALLQQPQQPHRVASSAALLSQQISPPKPIADTERQQIINLQRQYPLQFLNIRQQVKQQKPDLAGNPVELDRLAYRYLLDWLRDQQQRRQQQQQQQSDANPNRA